ncbi:MAG: phosphatidylserine decarboxylase family protein [Frankiales bacterium]|nr:phosphatidylserine decarboxylase family protein [Frankiales bacterium]
MSRHTWPVARRYVLPPLALGLPLAASGRRSGWALAGLGVAVLAFFRDPERATPGDPAVIYAASDGFVTGVDDDVEEPWLPGGRGARVTVFLSVSDVHVNRSPVDGVLARSEQVGEGFAPALLKGAQDNRRNRLLIEGEAGPVVVVQVAGAIARTISNWVAVGDRLTAGQRLGVIHFGSRTDVLLPVGAADVLVRRGTRVTAGVTPLFRLRAG